MKMQRLVICHHYRSEQGDATRQRLRVLNAAARICAITCIRRGTLVNLFTVERDFRRNGNVRISGHRKGLPEPLTPTTRSHNLIDRVKEKIKSMTRRKNTIRGATHHVHVCKCALVWCCREAECAHRGNIYSDDPKFPKDNPNCERCGTKDSGEPNANTPSDYCGSQVYNSQT